MKAKTLTLSLRAPWRRLGCRPGQDPEGFSFGFVYRFIAGFSAATMSAIIVFMLGALTDWQLGGLHYFFLSVPSLVTILVAEHMRMRVHERFVERTNEERYEQRTTPSGQPPVAPATRREYEQKLSRDYTRTYHYKRSFDIAMSALLLLLAAPLIIMTGAVIKLESKGPILYRMHRYDYAGRRISILRFRTVRTDLSEQESKGSGNHRNWLHHDTRITRLGSYLRRTGLDHLPMLFSVLGGSVSLVGPWALSNPPTSPVPAVFSRVRPGIVGLEQLRHRGVLLNGLPKFENGDLYYIEHRSLWLDIRILATTIRVVLTIN